MWNYRLYNLNIQSTIELPNIITCQIERPNKVDVEVNNGTVAPIFDEIHYIKEWDELIYTVGVINGKVATLVNYKAIARYLIQDGQKITVQKMPLATVVDMESFLMSLALSSLLFQRKYFILHASAIVKNGGAYIFLGNSGAGKTTTTIGFLKDGCTILSEDVTVLEYINGVPHVLPSIPYLKLLEKVADKEGYDWEGLSLLYGDDEKRAYILDGKDEYETETIPLKKIYTLTANGVPHLQLSNIEGEEKFAAIAMNIHYPHFFEGYPIEDYYTDIAYQLMEEIPFRSLERPQGKNTLTAMLELLQQDFTEEKVQPAVLGR